MSEKTPETYLSKTALGWTLIHQGMPLLWEKASFADCCTMAARMKLTIPLLAWIGALGRFGTVAEAKDAKFPAGDLLSNQPEHLILRGESGPDNAKIAADAAQAEQDRQEAKAIADSQPSLFDPSGPGTTSDYSDQPYYY